MSILKTIDVHPKELIRQACGLCLGYGNQAVLREVDLEVKVGEFWYLLGQNGTGKTTLLKAMLGLLPPQSGTISLHPVLAQRERMGFVPQRCEFNPSLPTTVREFVLLGLVGIRTNRRDRSERVGWSLEKVGMLGMATDDYWSLSGGQRQRVLVARALARYPSLLIMDEPTSGLDPAAETVLLEYLAILNREEKLTVVCVSHDLTTAARHGSHVALFHKGRVQAGPVRKVLSRENLERIYGIRLDVQWQDQDDPAGSQANLGTQVAS